MSVKAFAGVEIKSEDKGTVTAVFATLGVVDSDGDVTKQGAFTDGAEVVISAYGHRSWDGVPPVGKGVIRAGKSDAVLDGQFFLDTAAGADTFRTVKRLGGLGQWSYGYDAVKYSFGEHDGQQVRFLEELKVHEVSPVLVGAGVGTRTLAAKSAQGMRFSEEAEAVMAAVKSLGDRAADVMARRQEKGKGLGEESASLLGDLEAELKRLGDLLRSGDGPDGPEDDEAVRRELLRFERLRAGI